MKRKVMVPSVWHSSFRADGSSGHDPAKVRSAATNSSLLFFAKPGFTAKGFRFSELLGFRSRMS
jgi:hypothetical protein